ncbi:MAG TPA: proton-conducting transporter membrane subunit [Candidatus Hydrogenedens sp.]|nr:proton-conducting transporter membrane subunit [Candidatus Hydrogenedens sp.]HOL20342.1 proton-conducting transporter membrane subunit [Candidatus Hydrogenedens sp.]HPP57836.1 proton-conducting transporter membrane subunit [Candidatus Hydrogenedens sp.]
MIFFWILTFVFVNAILSTLLSPITKPYRNLLLSILPAIALLLNILVMSEQNTSPFTLKWLPSLGLNVLLAPSYFSLMFGILILSIGLIIHIYASIYLHTDPSINYWHFWFFIFMGSMLGVVFSSNLFLLFLFWEITSLASFFLIGHFYEQEDARKSAWEALLITGGGGLCLLTGFILIYIITGTADLPELKERINEIHTSPYLNTAVILIILGILTKSAQFPFHFWLPDAMTAPAPASAYLHSATMVKAGVFLSIQLSDIFSGISLWNLILISSGAVTFLLGAISSIKEDSIKRALAYTTISTLGLLTFLIGIGTPATILSAMILIFAHAIYKAGLFLTAGTLEFTNHCKYFSKSHGIWKKHPYLFLTTLLLLLSLTGIPFTFSFLTKEEILKSLLNLHPTTLIPSILLFIVGNIFIVGFSIRFLIKPWQKNSGDNYHHSINFMDYLLATIPLFLSLLGFIIPFSPSLSQVFHYIGNSLKFLSDPHIPNHATSSVTNHFLLLTISIIIWFGGIILGIFHIRTKEQNKENQKTISATYIYQTAIESLIFSSDRITRFFQNGKLRSYLSTFSVSIILISFVSLVIDWQNINIYVSSHISHTTGKIYLYDLILILTIIIGIAGVISSSSKLTAVICLGIVGYSIAVIFLIFSAPDLAMTQFIIETLTVALFVFVFYHLPEQHLPRRTWTIRRDVVLSIIFGIIMGFITLTASSIQTHPTISSYFASKSLSEAHGSNIVNVILVDFRGFDTMGEITVLAIAGIGTYALLRYQRIKNHE